jgi:arylsulfatase A-like enzyme
MSKPRLVIFFLFILAAGVLVFLWWARRSESSSVRNVLLISIDTCRADHLGCYGYGRDTTPHIDQLAREGILFENAVSPVPMTLPAHSSMLCGTNPPHHGVHTNLDQRLGPSNVTLAEILRDRGFVTGAVVSAFVLDSQFGLDQGFETYDDQFDTEASVHGSERKGRLPRASRTIRTPVRSRSSITASVPS